MSSLASLFLLLEVRSCVRNFCQTVQKFMTNYFYSYKIYLSKADFKAWYLLH